MEAADSAGRKPLSVLSRSRHGLQRRRLCGCRV